MRKQRTQRLTNLLSVTQLQSCGLQRPWVSCSQPYLTLDLSASFPSLPREGRRKRSLLITLSATRPRRGYSSVFTGSVSMLLHTHNLHTRHPPMHTHWLLEPGPCRGDDDSAGLCCCRCFAQEAGSWPNVLAASAKRKLLARWFSWVGRGDKLCHTPGAC